MSSNEIVFGGQEPAPPSLQEAIENNRRKALFQSISVAANQDPKHVAEAMRYGFSPMAPREALDQERKARNVRKVYDSVLDYPVASSFFQDPAFASIAIKDADNIGILENLARTAVSVPTGLAEAGLSILELTQGQASAFVDYLRIKIKQNAWEHMTPEQRRQFRQQDLARRGLTEYPYRGEVFQPLGEMVTTKMRRGLQELTKDFKPQAKTLFGEALISAGTSIGQFAVLLPFGPAGILTGFGALSFGQGLEAGRQAGLETGDQIRYAAMDAIAEIGFAALPLQKLFASTKSGSSFLRSFWEFSAAEVPAEMATTLTQSFNRWARIDSQRGQSFDDWLSGLGREEALTVLATLMSSAGFSALAHRAQVQITNQAREQGLAEARARGIAQMADRLRELELTSEAPEAARQLMNGILQEASDVDRLRVEASRLAEAIEQVGVDKVRAALPGVVEALQQSGTEPGVEADVAPGVRGRDPADGPAVALGGARTDDGGELGGPRGAEILVRGVSHPDLERRSDERAAAGRRKRDVHDLDGVVAHHGREHAGIDDELVAPARVAAEGPGVGAASGARRIARIVNVLSAERSPDQEQEHEQDNTSLHEIQTSFESCGSGP